MGYSEVMVNQNQVCLTSPSQSSTSVSKHQKSSILSPEKHTYSGVVREARHAGTGGSDRQTLAMLLWYLTLQRCGGHDSLAWS